MRGVCGAGNPFCVAGTVDGGEGKLTGLVGIWRGDGEALRDVPKNGGNIIDIAVGEGERAVREEVVGCGVVVADLHRDGSVRVGCVGGGERSRKSCESGGGLIGNGRDWPTLPIEGAVA